eukprot:1157424-Pelagomonas_calceolata.AAC.3
MLVPEVQLAKRLAIVRQSQGILLLQDGPVLRSLAPCVLSGMQPGQKNRQKEKEQTASEPGFCSVLCGLICGPDPGPATHMRTRKAGCKCNTCLSCARCALWAFKKLFQSSLVSKPESDTSGFRRQEQGVPHAGPVHAPALCVWMISLHIPSCACMHTLNARACAGHASAAPKHVQSSFKNACVHTQHTQSRGDTAILTTLLQGTASPASSAHSSSCQRAPGQLPLVLPPHDLV